MRNPILSFYLIAILGCSLLFSACTKENSVLVEIKEEALLSELNLKINNQTLTTNAFAAYCINGDKEFLAVSNKEVLLDTVLLVTDFEENDFTFLYSASQGMMPFTIGGAAFGESVTGIPGLQIVFGDANVNIDSNDGTIVNGSMDGDFIGLDPLTGQVIDLPFSVTFAALIVMESPVCE